MSFQNWHEDFDEFWPEHLKISKICPLMGCLSTKYTVFKLKKYRGVMFDGTGHWCKIWTKIDFCFQKWHEEFGKHQSTWKYQNLNFSMGFFYPKYELEIYRGVICHDNEKRCKIGRGIDLSFQNWREDFDEFWPEHSNISKLCTLMRSFWSKYITFELKKYRGVIFDGIKDRCKIWRKPNLCFLKWHEEFFKFSFIGWKIAISF